VRPLRYDLDPTIHEYLANRRDKGVIPSDAL
jgi:hypothetical protein